MGFGRILGYIFSIIWILASLFVLPYSLIWIWAPFVIIIVLRRQAKREIRMEGYAKSQAESMQKMSNPNGLTDEQQEMLDDERKKLNDQQKWLNEQERKKLTKQDKNIQVKYRVLDNDTDNDNKKFEEEDNK